MKRKYIVGFVFILIFAFFAGWSFRSAMTPYVSFAEAKELSSQAQVLGYFVGEEISYDPGSGRITFELKDEEGSQVRIFYDGVPPDNLDHAESVVVVGKFQGEDFTATRILVKCPSKYEKEQD